MTEPLRSEFLSDCADGKPASSASPVNVGLKYGLIGTHLAAAFCCLLLVVEYAKRPDLQAESMARDAIFIVLSFPANRGATFDVSIPLGRKK